jgi:hypothetical protein
MGPLEEKWTQAGVPSYLEDLRAIAVGFAETEQGDLMSKRQFPDEEELLRNRIMVKRAGQLYFASDRLAAFLVADSLVKNILSVETLKLVPNGQWKLIMDLVSQELDWAGADVLVAILRKRHSLSDTILAEHFIASVRINRPGEFAESWMRQVLLSLAQIRQDLILGESVTLRGDAGLD